MYTWGSNEYGQLGLVLDTANAPKPTLVKLLVGLPISFIACGGYHSFAVSKSGNIIWKCIKLQIYANNIFQIGAVFGWGKNDFGQLGLNNQINVALPTQLKTMRTVRVKYITAGEDFSVFLTYVYYTFI